MTGTINTSKKKTVRMATIFSQMLHECPVAIQVYGKCVAELSGGINRHVCEKEFQNLRLCFNRVARDRRV
ncbi:putative NADH dehydrogenase [ubiquinone] 1 alpha subcomplex assembly factor 8 [Plasmopara halstedii]